MTGTSEAPPACEQVKECMAEAAKKATAVKREINEKQLRRCLDCFALLTARFGLLFRRQCRRSWDLRLWVQQPLVCVAQFVFF